MFAFERFSSVLESESRSSKTDCDTDFFKYLHYRPEQFLVNLGLAPWHRLTENFSEKPSKSCGEMWCMPIAFPFSEKNNKEPRKQHKQTSGIRCYRERILLSRLSNALWPRDDDEGKLFFLKFERKTKTKDEHGEVKTHYNRKKLNSMCWMCEQGERAPEP